MDKVAYLKYVNESLLALELKAKRECERIQIELSSRAATGDPFLKDYEIVKVRFQFFWSEKSSKWRDDTSNVAGVAEIDSTMLGMPYGPDGYSRALQILTNEFDNASDLQWLDEIGAVWTDIVVLHQGSLENLSQGSMVSKAEGDAQGNQV